jgi:competence protein ComEA
MDNRGTWLDQNRHFVFIGLLLAVIAGGAIFYFGRPAAEPIEIIAAEPSATPEPTATITPAATPTPGMVRVYITGAVAKSDVYFLPQGSIIKDAVEAAGGFNADADPERINQALELKDQQQIHVPRLDEVDPPPPVQGGSENNDPPAENNTSPESPGGGIININTATLEHLDTLPGIGPAIAQRIIDYREKIGGFKNIEQITEVSGIGEATFEKIKGSITIE